MNKKRSDYQQKLDGLAPLTIAFFVLMFSPLFYFLINVMLGNEEIFSGIIK
jgi:hypothetical protein